MSVKSLHTRKQRLDFGIVKNMSILKEKGLTREEWTRPWDDVPWMGTLYWIHKKSNEGKRLTYQDLQYLTGWRWRTIKNKLHHILLKSPLRTSIKTQNLKYSLVKFYMDTQAFLDLTFEELVRIVRNVTFKNDHTIPNRCEQLVLKWANELFPGEFIWGGGRVPTNKFNGYYPDLRHIDLSLVPVLIEHFGVRYHDEEQVEPRIERFKEVGLYTLIIWEYELKDKNTCKKKIKEFVEKYAIQDIQQLVV